MFFNKKYNLIYGKCLRKLLEANNEKYFVTKLLHSVIHSFIHSFIRSIMTRLLMNYGKPILLKMTKRK